MAEQPEALESEIQQLEQRLAQRRTELGQAKNAPLERSEVHAVVGEQIQQVIPSYLPPTSTAGSGATPSWQDPALAGAVQQLVNVAFTQSIKEAIMQALKADNPALLDALHDVLADELHQELLSRKKVQVAA